MQLETYKIESEISKLKPHGKAEASKTYLCQNLAEKGCFFITKDIVKFSPWEATRTL